jgi:hypothetical protein
MTRPVLGEPAADELRNLGVHPQLVALATYRFVR